MNAIIIKGCPRDKWDEVQAIQDRPFIYTHNCGSHWAGEDPDDIAALLEMLANHPLDPQFGHFYTVNPCRAIDNPKRTAWTEPRWIDGERLYSCNGTVRYFGNFFDWSFGFCIDTNDAPTIVALNAAIDANMRSDAYRDAVRQTTKQAA